jgi:hypothetical protein
MPFILALPWLLIIVALVFIVVLEWVVKRYSLAWRKPLLYSAVGVIVLVVASGFVVAQTSLHKGAYEHAVDQKLPLLGPMYRGIHPNPDHLVHPGIITEITDDGFFLEMHNGDIFTVIVDEATRLPRGADYGAGDGVVVIGQPYDGYLLQAEGVRPMDEDFIFRPRNGSGFGRPGMKMPKVPIPQP